MSKLITWLKGRQKAVAALLVAGIGSAITSGLLEGTGAALGALAVAVLTAGAVHQVSNTPSTVDSSTRVADYIPPMPGS